MSGYKNAAEHNEKKEAKCKNESIDLWIRFQMDK